MRVLCVQEGTNYRTGCHTHIQLQHTPPLMKFQFGYCGAPLASWASLLVPTLQSATSEDRPCQPNRDGTAATIVIPGQTKAGLAARNLNSWPSCARAHWSQRTRLWPGHAMDDMDDMGDADDTDDMDDMDDMDDSQTAENGPSSLSRSVTGQSYGPE